MRKLLALALFSLALFAQQVTVSVTATPEGSMVVIDVLDLAGGALVINAPPGSGDARIIESGGRRILESGDVRIPE